MFRELGSLKLRVLQNLVNVIYSYVNLIRNLAILVEQDDLKPDPNSRKIYDNSSRTRTDRTGMV